MNDVVKLILLICFLIWKSWSCSFKSACNFASIFQKTPRTNSSERLDAKNSSTRPNYATEQHGSPKQPISYCCKLFVPIDIKLVL